MYEMKGWEGASQVLVHRPVVLIAICWLLGIYFANVLSVGQAIVLFIGIGALLPLLIKTRLLTVLFAVSGMLVIAVSFVVFMLYDQAQGSQLVSYVQPEGSVSSNAEEALKLEGAATGIIHTTPELDGDRVQFQLSLQTWSNANSSFTAEALQELVLVNVKLVHKDEQELARQWKQGQFVSIQGSLEEPSTASNFGAFDYKSYLKTKHVYWLLQAKGASALHIDDTDRHRSLAEWPRMITAKLEAYRQHSAELYRQLFTSDESSYLEGLVLGLRSGLDPEIEQSFAQLGLTHVLAISGLHVGVFVGSCLLLLRLCRLTHETSLLIVICLIPIYVLFTGASPSVIRAGVMSMLSLIGLRQGWLRDGLHLLSAALLLMLWWEPYYALDVSFQLSFAVTTGLIIGVSPARRLLPSRWPEWLRSSIAVTVVAQLVSFPLTIYYFNQISILSLLTNFVLVPFISLIVLPLASIALAIAVISVEWARPAAWIISQCDQLTFVLVDWLAQLEGTSIIWPKLPLWWMAAYYLALGLLLHTRALWESDHQFTSSQAAGDDTVPLDEFIHAPIVRRRQWGLRVVIPCSLLVLILMIGYTADRPADTIVSFLDVGQGDSTLIQTASGRNILIDGGGTISFYKSGDEWKTRRKPYEVGESRLVPLLKQRGVRHLDAVILTHGDTDHAGGLRAVLKHISVDRLIMNGTWKSSSVLTELYQLALEHQIPISSWDSMDSWIIDDETRLHVLSPIYEPDARRAFNVDKQESRVLIEESDQNEVSLVLLLTIQPSTSDNDQTYSMIFTGDAGSQEEKAILYAEELELKMTDMNRTKDSLAVPWPKQLDVLKVGHHGSKTSTSASWVERWKPMISTISAGKNNRYGHPDDRIVDRLKRSGSSIYRTDEHGEIQVKVTERGLKLRVKHVRMTQ